MIKITVRSVGSKEFQIDEKFVGPVVRDLAQVVYDETQAGADAHTKTGALFQSVFNRQTKTGRAVGHDTGRAPHAAFVLFGTKAHEIRPKEGGTYKSYTTLEGKRSRKGVAKGGATRRFLRWAGPGGFIFAKVVHHPGYKGDHYLNDAADKAIARFAEILQRHWKE